MTEETHARFSPSKLPRIIQCPGSVKLIEALNAEQTSSSAAEEGTYLHGVVAGHLLAGLGTITRPLHEDLKKHQEYKDACEDILFWVSQLHAQHAGLAPMTYVEHRVSLASLAVPHDCEYLRDVAGTADYIFICAGTLYVCDWKFGRGVVVEPDSDQLKAYAAGALAAFPGICNKVVLTIIQPRIPFDPVKSVEYTVEDINRWVRYDLVPALNKIDLEVPYLCPSEKACKWCPLAKDPSKCRARYEMAQQVASDVFSVFAKLPQNQPQNIDLVTPEELSELMQKIPMLDQYIKDIKGYALHQVASGRGIPGYKVVRGRSLRKWVDEEQAQHALELAGYELEDLSEVKFYSPAQVEKVIGKKKAKEDFFTTLVFKPEGKLTLADVADKRPAVQMDASTVFADFADDAE